VNAVLRERLSRGVWRDPDFRRLWGAVVISTYGTLVRGPALLFTAIFLLDASPADVGALRIAEVLPGFLVGLVAGAWVDRLRRRPIMIGTDLARALILLTIPLAAALGRVSLVQLLVVTALVSLCSVFFDVAYQSYLPTLVRNEDLVSANSALTGAMSVVESLAFSTGGWLVQLFSAPMAILADAVSFAGSAIFIGRIGTSEPKPAGDGAESGLSILHEALAGLAASWREPVLRALVIAGGAQHLAYGLIGTVYLLYLNQEVGFDPGALGMIFAVGGISAFLGAIAAARLTTGIGIVMIAALVLAAVGESFVPLATTVSLASVILLVMQQIVGDFALTIFEINHLSLRQAIVPAQLLGRVNATVRVAEFGALLVGTALAGVLGEALGLRATLWLAAGCSLLGAAALMASPVRAIARIPAAPVPVMP
jgi:MFS family permease